MQRVLPEQLAFKALLARQVLLVLLEVLDLLVLQEDQDRWGLLVPAVLPVPLAQQALLEHQVSKEPQVLLALLVLSAQLELQEVRDP